MLMMPGSWRWIAKTMFPGDAHDAGLSAVEWKMVFSSCS